MGVFNSRIWLIIEPILLLIIFGLIARAITPMLGVAPGAADSALLDKDWGALAGIEARSMGVKWGLLLTAALALAATRGFFIARPAGAPPALSFGKLVLLGAALEIPFYLLAVLPRWYHYEVAPIGEVPPIWDIIYASAWTPEFWAFMAVSSFLLVPIVEELFFRGYVLGSLLTRFGATAAILICAGLFAVVHLQYARLDALALYNMASVFVVSAVLAWVVWRTRSLVPAIAAHAVGNTPRPLDWVPYETALLIPAAIILFWLWPQTRRPEAAG